MKTVTAGFKTAIQTNGREISAIITYQSIDSYYILTTENDIDLLTELEENIVTERGPLEFVNEEINSITPLFNIDLFKTVMKYIEIDCNNVILKNTRLNFQFGIKVSGIYEYLNFGNYLIINEPVYNADTKSYKIMAYDKMVESMTNYDDNPLSITYPITYKNMIIAICEKFGWNYDFTESFANESIEITEELYLNQNMTYRDILDDLCCASGGNFMFDANDIFVIKYPTETNEIINDDYLKNININFGKLYGPINAITITSENDTVINSKEDLTSIESNGKTEYNFNNNKLLLFDSDSFIDAMFTKINGMQYYIYDICSIGICIFDPLDRFTFNHNNENYSTLMLNDKINITQGISEECYIEIPKETKKEYVSSAIDDLGIKNAIVSINKAKSQIVLKADDNNKIVKVELNADASSGSEFKIIADNIKLEGYTTINNGFSVDLYGNMTANNGSFSGDIYFTNGGKILGSNGLLSLFQFSSYEIDLGWFTMDDINFQKHGFGISYNIPENFEIINAYVSCFHIPCYNQINISGTDYYYYGYARNVKLYNVDNIDNLIYSRYGWTGEPDYNLLTKTLITTTSDTWGSSGFTGLSNKTTTHITQNINDELIIGSSNMLFIETADASVSSTQDSLEKTARANATLTVIGYYKYE